METKGCFIDGRWVETEDRLLVLSPWSGELVGEVALAGEAEWEEAIVAAERTAVVLKKFSGYERRRLLEKLAQGVKERLEDFAQTILAEGGKPITFSASIWRSCPDEAWM